MRAALAWGGDNGEHAPYGATRSTPSPEKKQPHSGSHHGGVADFRPAGGTSGIDRPTFCAGRRGSSGKMVSLSGGGVSRAICWEKESDGPGDEGHGRGTVEGALISIFARAHSLC